MLSNYVYIIGTNSIAGINALTKLMEFFNTNNFQLLKNKIPPQNGYIEINIDGKEFNIVEELIGEVKGPNILLKNDDDLTIILNYIRGNKEIRDEIIKRLSGKIRICHSTALNGSPAFQFSIKAYAEFTNPENDTLTISGETKVFYAIDEERDKIIGCILFDIIPNGCYDTIYIKKSYVDPEYRKQGIWKMIWFELVTFAKVSQIPKINSRVYKHNDVMKQVCEHADREQMSHNYTYKVEI